MHRFDSQLGKLCGISFNAVQGLLAGQGNNVDAVLGETHERNA